MQFSTGLVALALAAFAVLDVAQGQVSASASGSANGTVTEVQTGIELEQAKAAAFEEAEMFQVGDTIVASAELVISVESTDPEVVEIAEDPDIIAEEELEEEDKSCCPEGAFCCGMELGCLPEALAPDVMCPVIGPDSPIPCCTRKL